MARSAISLLLLLWTVAHVTLCTTATATTLTHIGCFTADSPSTPPEQYLLPDVTLRLQHAETADASLAQCQTVCSERAYAYLGVNVAQHHCHCAKQLDAQRITDQRVSDDCCGAHNNTNYIDVYHNPLITPDTLPTHADTHRPLLALVMIVKDEGHTIVDTLQSVSKVVDAYYILDTGSTDDTVAKIEQYLATTTVPGRVFHDSFVDYGTTRNRILELVVEATADDPSKRPVFTLMLSADESLPEPQQLRAFLSSMRLAAGQHHSAYPVMMHMYGTDQRFESLRLARVDSGWRYRERVHEYLAPPNDQPYTEVYRPAEQLTVLFNATDGERRLQSQWKILKILQEDLQANLTNTRSWFYLARTYSALDLHYEAYNAYVALQHRSNYVQQRYNAMVMQAVELRLNGSADWQQRQKLLLAAHTYYPQSIDALYTLAADHYLSGRYNEAYNYAQQAVQIPMQSEATMRLFESVLMRSTRVLYQHEAHRLLGHIAQQVQDLETCIDSFRRVVAVLGEGNDDYSSNARTECEVLYMQQGGDLSVLPRYTSAEQAHAGVNARKPRYLPVTRQHPIDNHWLISTMILATSLFTARCIIRQRHALIALGKVE